MAKRSLVDALEGFLHYLIEEEGTAIDRAALLPAYEGMVPGLVILVVSMPGEKAHFEKTKYLIHMLYKYVPQDERQSVTGVQVFGSPEEFDDYVKYGYVSDSDETPPLRRSYLKPDFIRIAA